MIQFPRGFAMVKSLGDYHVPPSNSTYIKSFSRSELASARLCRVASSAVISGAIQLKATHARSDSSFLSIRKVLKGSGSDRETPALSLGRIT
jgi:hypothetical protein